MKEQSLRKTAISGIFWTLTQQFGSQGIQFIVSIILARLLMPEEFGLIGMIAVFYAIGTTLIDSGLTQSLIRSGNLTQIDYSTIFFFNLFGSLVIYLIIFLCAPFIASFYNQPLLEGITRVYCVSFLINAFSSVQMSKLTKEMKFKTQLIISLPSLIVSSIAGVYLALEGYGVWSLVWMSLIQATLNSIQLWIYSKWTPSLVFDLSVLKTHFSFGYKLTLSSLLNTIFSNIYQIIIGRYFIASLVGFYTRANSLKQLPVTNFSKALDKVTFPLFASIQHDDVRLKSVYKQIMQMVLFLIAPILTFMAVLAEPLFRFLFTEKWLPAVPYFQVLCLTGILYPIHSYNLNVLKVKGRSDLFLKLEVIKKIIIVLTIVVSIQFGIMGLIWGQVFTSGLAFFINTYYTGKFIRYGAWQQFVDIIPVLALSFLVGAGVFILDQKILYRYIDFARLSIGVSIGAFLYLSLMWWLKNDIIQSFKKIILKRQ